MGSDSDGRWLVARADGARRAWLAANELRVGVAVRHLLFGAGAHSLGIEAAHVREIVRIGHVSRIATRPDGVRGVVHHAGARLPLVDVRALLGERSHAQAHAELLTSLSLRKQDHLDWVAELAASVVERRPFAASLDPERCRFGRWYRGLAVDDPVLRRKLGEAEAPHQKIHALADVVVRLGASGAWDEALALVREAETTDLRALCRVLDELLPLLDQIDQEVVLVAESGGRRAAIVVDPGVTVVDLERDALTAPDESAVPPSLRGLVGRMAATGEGTALILQAERLLQDYGA